MFVGRTREDYSWTISFQRLILILFAIMCAAALLVAGFAVGVSEMNEGPVGWVVGYFAAGVAIGAGLAAYLSVRAFRQGQAEGIREHFRSITPDEVSAVRDPMRMVEAVARSLSQVLSQASKDKAQLLTILSAMSDGLIAVDARLQVLLVNDAARELLSLPEDGKKLQPLWEMVSEKQILQSVHEAMLTGQQRKFTLSPTETRHLEVTIARLPRTDQPAGLIIVIHDITESTRYETLRKEFVANVSHELRTPLTMIKGFVETLKDGAIDDRARAIEYLNTVERHSDQLTNLVTDLLDLSRLESGAQRPAAGRVSVESIVRRAVDLMMPAAHKKSHSFTAQIEPNLPMILGNADDLQRAVANLIENAIKYTRDGGRITVSATSDVDEVIIEVADNGIGIGEEDLPRIFERFYRADRSRSREMGGTGLGLSIVKHVVQSHGGTVEVSSRPGAGSTFRLKFSTGALQAQSKLGK